MIHYCVGWCDGWCDVVTSTAKTRGVQVLIQIFFPSSLFDNHRFRWTTLCYRTCVTRRRWQHWRTPLIWFTSRWPSQDLCISTICTLLQTTPAVRIYLFLLFKSSWSLFTHCWFLKVDVLVRNCILYSLIHEQPAPKLVHVYLYKMFDMRWRVIYKSMSMLACFALRIIFLSLSEMFQWACMNFSVGSLFSPQNAQTPT